MFYDNAAALNTLKVSVTSQSLVSSYVTCTFMCKTHLWLGGKLGHLGFIFNINCMVPSPLPLIMGGKQCWVSNLNREKTKGDTDKYQMKWVRMALMTKPNFSLWTALHHHHHLHWQCLCGVGHCTAGSKSRFQDHLTEGCFKSSMKQNEQKSEFTMLTMKVQEKPFSTIWSSHMSKHLFPSKHHSRKC